MDYITLVRIERRTRQVARRRAYSRLSLRSRTNFHGEDIAELTFLNEPSKKFYKAIIGASLAGLQLILGLDSGGQILGIQGHTAFHTCKLALCIFTSLKVIDLRSTAQDAVAVKQPCADAEQRLLTSKCTAPGHF